MIARIVATAAVGIVLLSGCEWRGPTSVPLPGAVGRGADAYQVTVVMPDVVNVEPNSRVRVADIDVGTITSIRLDEQWHAQVTLTIQSDVELPANVVAKVGQTSLLGVAHIELNPPADPQGTLKDGDVIPIERAGAFPTTEQTLAAASTVLNGGGLGQIQQITIEVNNALQGRTGEVRNLLTQLDRTLGTLDGQKDEIISATESLDQLSGKIAAQNDTLTQALDSVAPALQVLNQQREQLTTALEAIGNFSLVADNVATASREDLVANLRNLSPVLRSLAEAGQDLPDALRVATFPFPIDTIDKFVRGDYANLSVNFDLTLSRLDTGFLSGTPLQGSLTTLEMALGRTQGLLRTSTGRDPLTQPIQEG